MTQKIWKGDREPKRKAAFGLVAQHTSPTGNAARAARAETSARQQRKATKAARRATKAAA